MAGESYYQALPGALKPLHYDVSIRDVDDVKETFSGTVKIALQALEKTLELHLNYRQVTVKENDVSVTVDGRQVAVKGLREHVEKEFFVIEFAEEVAAGLKLEVVLEYGAIIHTNMAGFYKSTYSENGTEKVMLLTQFEATDARRAFPCLDEPAWKSSFLVDVTVKSEWTVLGNTPVLKTDDLGSLQRVFFEKTPVMLTYLVAWAAGDFEYIESFTKDVYHDEKPLPVRIYTTKGHVEEAVFASSIAPKIVDYFSKIFETKYPLPKLDLLAVHAFSHNAMENWGLITYRSTALLFLEKTSDPLYRQKVAYVVAHELAHQWFGNLVTMKWWDELWLNEGFATWVGFAAVDYLFPEWDIFSGFVLDLVQLALNLDGLRNSHPIEVPIADALDIDQVFDAISYQKGSAVIMMLLTYLGRDVFLRGVARYLNAHKYGNATTADLWRAISEVSGQPVAEHMISWIEKIGFPVVNVDVDGTSLKVSQKRYLNEGNVTSEEDQTVWWVPLNFSTGPGSKDVVEGLGKALELTTREASIENFPVSGFFKLNKDTAGAYRVNYAPSVLHKNILPHFSRLSLKDKVGVIADVASIGASGDKNTSTATFLDLIKAVAVDSNELGEFVVWLELGKRLSHLLMAFCGPDGEISAGLKALKAQVYGPKAIHYAKNSTIDHSLFVEVKLRLEVLKKAAGLDIPEVTKYAEELFEKIKAGKSIDPSLRAFVFTAVISNKKLVNDEVLDILFAELKKPTSLDSREIILSALGGICDDKLAGRVFDSFLDLQVVSTMDLHLLAQSLSSNPSMRDRYWKFFQDNYDYLYKLMSGNMVVFDRFVRVSLGNYQSLKTRDDIEAFFKTRSIHGFERSFKQVLDNNTLSANWYNRDKESVKEWLKEKKFL